MFPEVAYRGLKSENELEEDKITIGLNALNDFRQSQRNTDKLELSINWDGEGSLNCLRKIESDNFPGEKLFKIGYFKIKRSKLDALKGAFHGRAVGFDYEKAPLENNIFHGNLLLNKNVNKGHKRTVLSALLIDVCDSYESWE